MMLCMPPSGAWRDPSTTPIGMPREAPPQRLGFVRCNGELCFVGAVRRGAVQFK